MNPPWAAQIAAACGLARNLMRASPAGERRISTSASPPATTIGPACRPTAGKGKASASTPSRAPVSPLMTPATKSPSNTMAAADDTRIEHPGHQPQRRGDRWIGPADPVRGQQVITRRPGQLQVEVGEPVGERPPVTAADRERGAAGARELAFQGEQ